MLKLISIWDSKVGMAPSGDTQPTVPSADTGQSDTDHTDSEKTEYERKIDEIMGRANELRDEYVSKLETMYSDAEVSLTELVKKENSDDEVTALVSDYLTEATVLEQQCDAQFDEIVNELEQLIISNDGDRDPLNDLIETYITEKATKKAWYLDRLEEKGLIS